MFLRDVDQFSKFIVKKLNMFNESIYNLQRIKRKSSHIFIMSIDGH